MRPPSLRAGSFCLETPRDRRSFQESFFGVWTLIPTPTIQNPKAAPQTAIQNSLLLPNAYLITLSARISVHCGIVRPICFAVLRLITNSNFIGCSTGRSAGFVPFRILST